MSPSNADALAEIKREFNDPKSRTWDGVKINNSTAGWIIKELEAMYKLNHELNCNLMNVFKS